MARMAYKQSTFDMGTSMTTRSGLKRRQPSTASWTSGTSATTSPLTKGPLSKSLRVQQKRGWLSDTIMRLGMLG